MSEAADVKQSEVKEAEPLFSKKTIAAFKDPLDDDNPITVQVLGICSALAVTTQVKPSFIMALAVIFVLVGSNLIISLLRHSIPSSIRIIVQLTIVASLVILVDLVLKAYLYDISKQLSVFVGLIITNCIIMGRLEAFAMANKPVPSLFDALGNGLGYGGIILAVAIARELLGAGKIAGIQLIPDAFYDIGYVNNGVMVQPAGALFVVALLIWGHRAWNQNLQEERP